MAQGLERFVQVEASSKDALDYVRKFVARAYAHTFSDVLAVYGNEQTVKALTDILGNKNGRKSSLLLLLNGSGKVEAGLLVRALSRENGVAFLSTIGEWWHRLRCCRRASREHGAVFLSTIAVAADADDTVLDKVLRWCMERFCGGQSTLLAEVPNPMHPLAWSEHRDPVAMSGQLSKLGFRLVDVPYFPTEQLRAKPLMHNGMHLMAFRDGWDPTFDIRMCPDMLVSLIDWKMVSELEVEPGGNSSQAGQNIREAVRKRAASHLLCYPPGEFRPKLELRTPQWTFKKYSIAITFFVRYGYQIDLMEVRRREIHRQPRFQKYHLEPYRSFMQDITKVDFWESMPLTMCLNPKHPTVIEVQFPDIVAYQTEGLVRHVRVRRNTDHKRTRIFRVFDNVTLYNSGHLSFSFTFTPCCKHDPVGGDGAIGARTIETDRCGAGSTADSGNSCECHSRSTLTEFHVLNLMKLVYHHEVGPDFRDGVRLRRGSEDGGEWSPIIEFFRDRIAHYTEDGQPLETILNWFGPSRKESTAPPLTWDRARGGVVELICPDAVEKLLGSYRTARKAFAEERPTDAIETRRFLPTRRAVGEADEPPTEERRSGKPRRYSETLEHIGQDEKFKALMGIVQGIMDFPYVDAQELLDSMMPSFDRGCYMFMHPRFLLNFTADARSFDQLQHVTGADPYLLRPAEVCLYNGLLASSAEDKLKLLLRKPGGGRRQQRDLEALGHWVRGQRPYESRIYTRTQIFRRISNNFLPNFFRYPTEQALYESAHVNRGIFERKDNVHADLEETHKILDLVSYERAAASTSVINTLLVTIGVLQVVGALPTIRSWWWRGGMVAILLLGLFVSALFWFCYRPHRNDDAPDEDSTCAPVTG